MGVMYYAERIHPAKVTVILNEIGLGRIWYFTFKQGQNTRNCQVNHFRGIIYNDLSSMS